MHIPPAGNRNFTTRCSLAFLEAYAPRIHISGVSRLQYEGNAEQGELTLYLYDRIYPWAADDFTYIQQEMSWRKGKLHLRLNTPGGDVFAANAIANLLKSASYEVHTWNDGLAASMGSVLFIAARKGNCHDARSSILMVHYPSSSARRPKSLTSWPKAWPKPTPKKWA